MSHEEERLKATCAWEELIKGEFRTYFMQYPGCTHIEAYVYYKEYPHYIYSRSIYISQGIDSAKDIVANELFTDEELISPCLSMNEFVKRKFYLEQIYGNCICRWFSVYEDLDSYVYDPIEKAYALIEHKDFVEHRMWLYAQLVRTIKPTIFPLTNQYLEGDRMVIYLSLLPYAADDDPMLGAVMEYIKKNAGAASKRFYERGPRSMTMKLIEGGYVKKPTLRKLLEMANEKDDAQFAAILVDMLGESTKKGSKFIL